ncbi:hypothetical protein GCG54_00007248 [Colletotrichum gloeosporioides]|uniref:Uncharacterized protein n=1 Tax=Colletotrichum gloeosporioides TaxID=474922 RepID=A0A8H4CN93_COLGL|nr:uncharacterized protein GCG54_00007248 [Colletotrichum gloeosporioides]KAF3806994.1 hypothetical protein GCG54_00007248 [Colletotrichum gloeosporioides]
MLPDAAAYPAVGTMQLSPDTHALYIRAMEDPSALSFNEKRQVMGRAPIKDEDNEESVNLFGRSIQKLIKKAHDAPYELTLEECEFIEKTMKTPPRNALDRLTPEHEKLEEDARGKVKETVDQEESFTEFLGVIAATNRAQQLRLDRQMKREWGVEADMRTRLEAAKDLQRPTWLQEMVDANMEDWGFIVFRTGHVEDFYDDTKSQKEKDDVAWARFEEAYYTVATHGLKYQWANLGGDELSDAHNSLFIAVPEQPTPTMADMRHIFRQIRNNGQIPSGIRKDCFLVADMSTVPFEWLLEEPMSYTDIYIRQFAGTHSMDVQAVDPDAEETVSSDGGFAGEINVPLTRVYDWLYYSLFAMSDSWDQRHHITTTQTWTQDLWGDDEVLPSHPKY